MIKLKVSATASLYKDWVTKRQLSMEVQISRTLNKGKYVILLVLVDILHHWGEDRAEVSKQLHQLSMEVQISRTLNKGKYVILIVLVHILHNH